MGLFNQPTRREQAMSWWNAKTFEEQYFVIIKNKQVIEGYPDRAPTTLTGREIELLWDIEH
jgi:hypothetical protein